MHQKMDKVDPDHFILESCRILLNERGIDHCNTHVKYGSFSKGMKALKQFHMKGMQGEKTLYRCDYCGHWHISDKPTAEERDKYNSAPFTDTYQMRSDYLARCVGKHRLRNRLSAQTFINLRTNDGMTPYPCPSCGAWHIGTKKNAQWVEEIRQQTEKALI